MASLKKIALLDSSFSALPILESINQSFAEIFIIGKIEDDFLCKFPNTRYISADYSDIDQLSSALSSYDIDFLVPGCNDVAYHSYESVLVNKLKKNINSDFYKLNNKKLFRELCHSTGIRAPHLFEKLEDAIGNHVIIKPELGFSGKGISECTKDYSLEELNNAFEMAKRTSSNNRAIVEQFITGQLFSVSIFVRNFKVQDIIIVKEYCLKNKYAVNWSFISNEFRKQVLSLIDTEIKRFPSLMNVTNGLLHIQCILNEYNEVSFIEATRRCPGDLFPTLVQLQTGKNYAAEYLKAFIPIDLIDFTTNISSEDVIIRHTSTNQHAGYFKGFYHQRRSTILSVPTLKFGEINSSKNKYRSGIHFYSVKDEPTYDELLRMEGSGCHSQVDP